MLFSIEEEYLNEELVQSMIELKNFKDNKKAKSNVIGSPDTSVEVSREEVEIFKKINEINKRKEEIKNSRQLKNI